MYNTKRFEKKVACKIASLIFQAEKFDLKKFLHDLFTEPSEYTYLQMGGLIGEKKLVKKNL